jgi:hypothetical protein
MNQPSADPDTVTRPPRHRWRAFLLAAVVFIAGIVVGSGLTVLVIVNRMQEAIRHPELAPQRISARLQRQLDLTDEQTAQVRAILAERQQALMRLRSRVQPEVEAELSVAFEQINRTLDGEQQRQWRKLFDELTAKWMPPMVQPATRPLSRRD